MHENIKIASYDVCISVLARSLEFVPAVITTVDIVLILFLSCAVSHSLCSLNAKNKSKTSKGKCIATTTTYFIVNSQTIYNTKNTRDTLSLVFFTQ